MYRSNTSSFHMTFVPECWCIFKMGEIPGQKLSFPLYLFYYNHPPQFIPVYLTKVLTKVHKIELQIQTVAQQCFDWMCSGLLFAALHNLDGIYYSISLPHKPLNTALAPDEYALIEIIRNPDERQALSLSHAALCIWNGLKRREVNFECICISSYRMAKNVPRYPVSLHRLTVQSLCHSVVECTIPNVYG